MKKVKAFIERGNDGTYSVYIDLENNILNYGIHGTGKTVKEAILDFNSAYESMKEFYSKKEKDFIEATFEFQYDVPSFLSYYSNILSLAGMERLTGVNQGQLSHYVNGRRNPSKQTIEKIEKKLHEFGQELSQVEFI
ncbi:MAG: helix-turn-helix domain-containing protein [Lutibacter sp.]